MKSRLIFKPLLALSIVLPSATPFSQVHAAAVFIKNSSFEQDRLSDGGYTIVTSPSGWSSGGNAGWQNPTSAIFQAVPDGVQTGFIGGGGGPSRGAISQILGEGVVANSRYTLSVDVGRRTDILLDDFVVELFSGGTLLTSGPSPANKPKADLLRLSQFCDQTRIDAFRKRHQSPPLQTTRTFLSLTVLNLGECVVERAPKGTTYSNRPVKFFAG